MEAAVTPTRLDLAPLAPKALKNAARLWFAVAAAGQWVFAVYVAIHYGGWAARGDLTHWNKTLPHGYVPGETMANGILAAHLLFAALITSAGTLQLIPQIRARFPAFHRWVGRSYMAAALAMALSGLYLTLSGRRVVGDLSQHLATEANALLILLCAGMAWRLAVRRDFALHRAWALRLFLVVNGVWFFRVGLMLSFILYGGPFGFDPDTFRGPFLSFLGIAQYALPLAVLQLYLFMQRRGDAAGRLATAALIVLLTVAMGIGIFGAVMGLWLPRITPLLAG